MKKDEKSIGGAQRNMVIMGGNLVESWAKACRKHREHEG